MLNKIVDSFTEVQDVNFSLCRVILYSDHFSKFESFVFDLPDVFDQIIKEF